MPDCFTEDPTGVIYLFNGFDLPSRWDTNTASLETVGIDAPLAPCVMSGSGNGGIVGGFYAYVRFVDRLGNYSNLSPLSVRYEPSTTAANVVGTSNTSPIVITTDAAHGLSNGQTVKITGVAGCTQANGIWSATVLTSTTFSLLGTTANGDFMGGGTVYTGVSTINYSNVEVPTSSQITGREILRNKDGDASTFYKDIVTTDITSTTFNSNTDSLSLTGPVPLFDTNGNDLAVVRYDKPPNFKSIAAHHLGRMFLAVNAIYDFGNVSVTNGSKTVNGIGVEWNRLTYLNRWLDVVGGDKSYQIDTLSDTKTITLLDAYTGSTDPYARYAIRPDIGEKNSIYWSEPGLPQAFPSANNRVLQEDPGAGALTGLLSLQSWLYVIAESRIYRFSFQRDPNRDGFIVPASKRGCVNNRCHVVVEGTAYMLDYTGIHAFSGNDDNSVSMQIQDLFRSTPQSGYKINWNASRYFHAVHDPGNETVMWFVALAGDHTPRHALCYQYRLQRWWVEKYAFPIGSSMLGRLNGHPQVFLGTDQYRILAAGTGTLDGPVEGSGTLSGTCTTTGRTWIKDSAATFPTAGLVGFPVRITGGRGKGQERIVYAVSGTKISVTLPWTVQLDTTSTYQLGGFQWMWRSGWLEWAEDDKENKRDFEIQFPPLQNAATFDLRIFPDLSPNPIKWQANRNVAAGSGAATSKNSAYVALDSTQSLGYVNFCMDGFLEARANGYRYMSAEVTGTPAQEPVSIYHIHMDGVVPR